jgi:hypothetical protein
MRLDSAEIWGPAHFHATTGEILRTLTINPNRRYHGTGNPTGGPKGPRKIKRTGPSTRVRSVLDVSRHHMERMTGIEPAFSAWEADVLPLNYIRKRRPH